MRWLWRRHRIPEVVPGHIGIRLRIDSPAGPLLDVDSDHLYFVAKWGNPCGPACSFACLPGCTKHGWTNVFPGDNIVYAGSDLTICVLPVILGGTIGADPS